MSFSMIDFIEKKRDKGGHEPLEFHSLITGLMDKTIPSYQLAAWLMAVYFNGLDDNEIMALTQELAASGVTYKFPAEHSVVDKHSTGGVGDKTSLVLIPLAAACGASISKLSGPGLGFTGGTVDKLEAIPGMRMHLTNEEFLSQLGKIGCAISGHSPKLAPAEGIFYTLRDVTGTVPSNALITTSIVSKKLAGGASSFVFDVKCGNGAFEKDYDHARELAEMLVSTSKKLGKRCSALITDMEQPLGEWVGNAMEVYESIEVLNGRGPSDTRELCLSLCGQMLCLSKIAPTPEEGVQLAERAIADGSALEKFAQLISEQGGDANVTKRPLELLPKAEKVFKITAASDGFITKMDALSIGEALRALGGGRQKMDDKIDPAVAIRVNKKIGDKVSAGEAVLEIYYNSDEKLKLCMEYLSNCWETGEKQSKRTLIMGRVL
ncbi:MAG: thymidine phosphorylase [Cloacibacillus sp.]